MKSVNERMARTLKVLEISPAQVFRDTGISESKMSMYCGGKSPRRITVDDVYKLKDAYGITLEWIYDGDPSGLPHRLALKLRKLSAA